MQSIPVETLIHHLKMNTRVILMQTEGVSHAESLLQPSCQGNCMNWVVGHILSGRDGCLTRLGLPPVLSPTELEMYDRGSQPLADGEKASPLAGLLERVETSLQSLKVRIRQLSQAELETGVDFGGKSQPLGEVLAFLIWHESYHVGQLELLRQLAGKNDQVI